MARRAYNLATSYRRLNRRHFGNRLAKPYILRWSGNGSLMGAAYRTSRGPIIVLNSAMRYWPKVAELTLLHEMVHIITGDHTHGRRFQTEMLRLAKTGALAHLW